MWNQDKRLALSAGLTALFSFLLFGSVIANQNGNKVNVVQQENLELESSESIKDWQVSQSQNTPGKFGFKKSKCHRNQSIAYSDQGQFNNTKIVGFIPQFVEYYANDPTMFSENFEDYLNGLESIWSQKSTGKEDELSIKKLGAKYPEESKVFYTFVKNKQASY
jgi:hypothetical protein